MAMSPAGLRTKNDWAGKDQQQLPDRQKELSEEVTQLPEQ
jgi:hypothetical protein